MPHEADVPEITAQELKEKILKRSKLVLFDVRPQEQYAENKIEGHDEIRQINVPYRELVAKGGKSDPIESIQHAIERELKGEIPEDHEVVAVCGKGISSQDLAKALHRVGYNARTLRDGMDAWSHLYHVEPVVESEAYSIYQMSRPARGCLSYVLISNGKAVVVDPLRHIEKYLEFAESQNARIELVIDTHGHADHISGGRALADKVGVKYYLHPYDGIHPIDVLPAEIPYEFMKDNQIFAINDLHIEALHIPGHTLGNVALLVNHNYLLTGDSIFVDSIARPDLGGHSETWAPIHYKSLKRLLELPDSTLVLPGHFSSHNEANERHLYAATIADLKARNEGVKKVLEGERALVDYILSSLPDFPQQYIEIKRVNAGLMTPDEEKASELELGRNICALSQAYEN